MLHAMRVGGMGLIVLAATSAARGQYGDIRGLEIAQPEDTRHVESTPPPEGALVLLRGETSEEIARSLGENWVRTDGQEAAWRAVEDGDQGAAVQVRDGGIISRETFDGHFKLHVEFRVPYEPEKAGQARGNSGVYLQGRYEVQILDSYGLDSKDNDCGGIYEVARPRVNACKAPTVWQSYDIEFWSPVCEGDIKQESARITVLHNGVKIHENLEIPVDNTRAGLGGDPCAPGPIHLQDHGDPVQYRNIWLHRMD